MKTENQELALIEDITEDKAPAIYGHNKLDGFYEDVKKKVNEVPDLTTEKGRARIASLSSKVSSSKTAIEKPGRAYLKRIKEMPTKIEKELREFVGKMDALRDEVRKPLTDYEAAKRERASWIAGLRRDPMEVSQLCADEIKISIDAVENITLDYEWLGDFEAEACSVKLGTLKMLKDALSVREKYEAEQAELEKLRAEAAACEQKEREERIAREAAEAARLRQIQEAEQAAAKAKQDAIDAAARAEREKQAAIDAERKRQADQAEAERLETEAREKNKAHAKKINNEALDDLVDIGLSPELAKAVVVAIAKGSVRNVKINY